MADLNFNITGLGDLIEEMKTTRIRRCEMSECINNANWRGRVPKQFNSKCLLDNVALKVDGACDSLCITPPGEGG